MNIDGLLLCSECENRLKVSPYKGGYGFFVVEPCVHCAATEQGVAAELLPNGFLQPRGSHDTDPFAAQDNQPAIG